MQYRVKASSEEEALDKFDESVDTDWIGEVAESGERIEWMDSVVESVYKVEGA